MTTPNPRRAPRLYQLATDALSQAIATGELTPGQALTQNGIATRFGISRAPARKALEDLAEAGLLERGGSGRYRVAATANGAANLPDPARRDPLARCAAPPTTPPTTTAATTTMTPPDRLRLQPSWELLYPEIEMAVVARSSLAAWRLNESVLARHYGVSRTVARDVVARMQQRGVLIKDDNGRWIAPALTPANLDELYELRWVLEPLAMEKAVPRLPHGYLASMRQELENAMAPGAALDAALLDRLEHRLHVEMLGYCNNRALMQAISLPQALLIAHHFLYSWTLELFGTEPFLGEHLDIIQRLEEGDVTSAKAALVAHLRISRRRAMLRIEAVQDLIPPDPLPYLERIELA